MRSNLIRMGSLAVAAALALCLAGCAKADEQTQAVIDGIDAIGEVTLESEGDIKSARAGYDKLTEDQLKFVKNADTLESAESELSALKVSQCIEAIDAIGEVTLDSKDAVDAANLCFTGLTLEERQIVTNKAALDEAKETLKILESNHVGDSVETNVMRFTLDRAELAIALDRRMTVGVGAPADGYAGGSYYLPKEYDAADDADNPFVASKGHTLVSMTFTVENLDRGSLDLFDSWHSDGYIYIVHDGKSYKGEFKFGAENENGEGWKDYHSSNVLLGSGETSSYKAYVDIPVEIEDLSSPFEIKLNLPNNSEGSSVKNFTYLVNY